MCVSMFLTFLTMKVNNKQVRPNAVQNTTIQMFMGQKIFGYVFFAGYAMIFLDIISYLTRIYCFRVSEKVSVFICKGLFRTLSNILDEAFFAKIIN